MFVNGCQQIFRNNKKTVDNDSRLSYIKGVNLIHITKDGKQKDNGRTREGGVFLDRAELRAEIARKQVTNRAIAAALGISEAAFYNKLCGSSEFKESEIRKLIDFLGMSADTVNRIFSI